VRKQREVIHQLNQQRGELAQVIWGNPWYYRQFGYEYALEGLWDTHRKIRAHHKRKWRVIEHADGFLAGYLCFHNEADSGGFGIHQLELTPETSYLEVMPSLLRQLWNLATDLNQGKRPDDIKLYLGHEHPAYQPIQRRTRIHKGDLQCLYIRVQDVVKFLRHIKPARNKNLAVSPDRLARSDRLTITPVVITGGGYFVSGGDRFESIQTQL
jgi:hypothetical protein